VVGQEELLRLVRLWAWVDRIEELCQPEVNNGDEADADWPVEGLIDAGVIRILESLKGVGEEGGAGRWGQEPILHCPVYNIRARRVALRACGWANEEDEDEEGAERRG